MSYNYADQYIDECRDILSRLDPSRLEDLAAGLADVRDRGGRLFVLGVGGSAATASHAVNDLRKLCGLEAYAPTDNVAELTARTNDDGWDGWLVGWLEGSRLRTSDAVFVLSVGGGDVVRGVSGCLVRAVELADKVGAQIYGIVGRNGGHTAKLASACLVIPPVYSERVTPHTEGIASVVLHLLVSHPRLQRSAAKWESTR